jgi:hypothetical protein
MRVGKIRVNSQGCFEALDCALHIAGFEREIAEIDNRIDAAGIERESALEFRPGELAFPTAERNKRARIVRKRAAPRRRLAVEGDTQRRPGLVEAPRAQGRTTRSQGI